ncbi:hypothetical protein PFLUOLIPICF7_19140 [Pseudomonas simiae]|nr:hypothetical protein PFLUOLIPICF7_19140 [Pseudomonas simiae]
MKDTKSEIEIYEDLRFRVSFDDFIRFLEGVPVTPVCANCGSSGKWALATGNGENENDYGGVTIYKMSYANDTLFRPFYSMSCRKCGSLRQFNAELVVNWLKDHPVEIAHG